jgi:hypothetical protein
MEQKFRNTHVIGSNSEKPNLQILRLALVTSPSSSLSKETSCWHFRVKLFDGDTSRNELLVVAQAQWSDKVIIRNVQVAEPKATKKHHRKSRRIRPWRPGAATSSSLARTAAGAAGSSSRRPSS